MKTFLSKIFSHSSIPTVLQTYSLIVLLSPLLLFSQSNNRDDFFTWIEPGMTVEGDMPSDGEYSKDGSIFAFIYQLSENIIFYNASTYEIIATVQVPAQPTDLVMGDSHAYVCCHNAQGVVEISLEDFSVTKYIAVEGTPCQVEVSPGDDTIYIACDSYRDGWIIAYDLITDQVIYLTHEPYIHNFGRLDPWGREQQPYTRFWLSPDGNNIIAGDTNTRPAIFNAATGHSERSFNIGGLRSAGFSRTGDTMYIYTAPDDSLKLLRVLSTDNSVLDSIVVAADILLIVDYSNMAINKDGSKVFIGDSWNGSYYLFNFDNYSCQFFNAMIAFNAPIFSSSDGEYAIVSSWLEIEFIDFESGQIFDTWSTGIEPGWPLCVSPVTNKLVAGNGTFYEENEYLFSFNFKDINDIFCDTTILCGESPEADAPVCAELLINWMNEPDKIVTANSISHNLSIIDFDDHQVDTIIHLDKMSGVKIVPGSDIAIVYGGSSGKTWIMSIDNSAIIDTLNIGQIGEVYITSDGLTGYLVATTSPNMKIIKININGGYPTIIDQKTIGASSCNYDIGNNYVHTTNAFSPDETMLLLGYNDPQAGPVINIVDAVTLDLLTQVPVPDECIYGFAFTDDSKRVIVTGLYDQIPIIYLDRENSFVENTISINARSFSAAYNPVDSMFYVLEQNNYLHIVDPLTGVIRQTLNTIDEYNVKVAIDHQGLPLVMTSTSIIYEDEVYPLPGPSSYLNYYPDNDLFIIPVPGPDVICVFDPKMVGFQQFKPGKYQDISIFPNPATEQIFIKSASEITRVKVCNIAGTEVFSKDFNDRNVKLSTSGFKPGVYVVEVMTGNGKRVGKMVIR